MNQEPLISVVMPVYNVASYIRQALNSLVNQTYKNLEIICVDDGSTDSSVEIIKDYQKEDPRIKLIKQKNQYAGVARNNGMAEASGKYICFLDSDDFFDNKMFTILVKEAELKNTDIIYFDYFKFNGHKKEFHKCPASAHGVELHKVLSPSDISDVLFQVDHGMPWNKFMRTQFVKDADLKFQALRNTNDEFFSRLISVTAKRIMFLDDCFVAYRINNGKSLQGSLNNSVLDFTVAFTAIYDELINRNFYKEYSVTYQKLLGYVLMWRLDGKTDYESFDMIAQEYAEHTIKHCKVSDEYISDEYRPVFRALTENNIAKAAFELNMMRKRKIENSRAMRLSRKLVSVLHR